MSKKKKEKLPIIENRHKTEICRNWKKNDGNCLYHIIIDGKNPIILGKRSIWTCPERKCGCKETCIDLIACPEITCPHRCPFRTKCNFAHGSCELKECGRHPKWKTKMCNHIENSEICPYGKRCQFAHSITELKLHTHLKYHSEFRNNEKRKCKNKLSSFTNDNDFDDFIEIDNDIIVIDNDIDLFNNSLLETIISFADQN